MPNCQPDEKKPANPPSSEPLIVGIGASAGGLAEISEILNSLPVDTGMAFVIVQHLSPDQDSPGAHHCDASSSC